MYLLNNCVLIADSLWEVLISTIVNANLCLLFWCGFEVIVKGANFVQCLLFSVGLGSSLKGANCVQQGTGNEARRTGNVHENEALVS
jgi:hypothetical protein